MRRTINRKSLSELAQEMRVLNASSQSACIGGGTGTELDPFTYAEYQQLMHSGNWAGGYVQGSVEHFTRDVSGNWVSTLVSDAIYIDADNHLLPDVVVTAPSGVITGNIYDERYLFGGPEDYPRFGISGHWLDTSSLLNPSTEGGYGSVGGGGGSSPQYTPTTDSNLPWTRSAKALKSYGFNLVKSGDKVADQKLGLAMETLLESKSFTKFLQRHKVTSGVMVNISATAPNHVYGRTISSSGVNPAITEHINPGLLKFSNGGIGAVSTIIHETIHARVFGVFASHGIDIADISKEGSDSYNKFHSEEFRKNAPGIYDYYSRCQDPQHDQMADFYRPLIKAVLRETFPKEAEDIYEALSWSGLQHTDAWKKIDKNVRSNYNTTISSFKGQ